MINLYNLLLHRDPENDAAVSPRVGRPIATIFADVVGSSEFAARIGDLSRARPTAEIYRGCGEFDAVIDWAAEALPLAAATGAALRNAADWVDADIALTRDPAVIGLVAALREPASRRAIERRFRRREGGVNLDHCLVSPQGRCFVSGWLDAAQPAPIRAIGFFRGEELLGTTTNVARCRHTEADAKSAGAAPDLAGFWAVAVLERPVAAGAKLEVCVTAEGEHWSPVKLSRAVDEARLRDAALEQLAGAKYHGDATVEAFFQLDNGVGRALIDLNAGIVERLVAGSYRMRFGARRAAYDGTIVVCLYQKPEFLMLQTALFSQCPGYERYEFVYVSNSPEIGERLANDAAIASRAYGVAITLILLPGNAGFGAANNSAAEAADTDRLIIVNPDVLPRDLQWPRHHAEMVRGLPQEQVRVFGTSLFYGDGSLMHGGMYIDVDGGFAIHSDRMVRRDVLRVEHYGKGAPAEAAAYRTSRPVPAVTGAFLSVDRAWFEKLGGFSRDYIFREYEDVDLCLRSLQAGTPVWVHDLPFWHFESLGSTAAEADVGGRLVNRWLMTATWGEFVKAELNGRTPAYFAGPRPVPAPDSKAANRFARRRRPAR